MRLLLFFCLFFFFKQKTAYEMRISDWSSDVCSSDLRPRAQDRGPEALRDPGGQDDEEGEKYRVEEAQSVGVEHRGKRRRRRDHGGERGDPKKQARPARHDHEGSLPALTNARGSGDRKRVVSGKSVSVRVVHGGRRIIKNTT